MKNLLLKLFRKKEKPAAKLQYGVLSGSVSFGVRDKETGDFENNPNAVPVKGKEGNKTPVSPYEVTK